MGVFVAVTVAAASSLTAGSLDPTYGSGGAVLEDFYGTQDPDQANAVTIQPDGKIVIAGFTGTGGFSPVAMVARYNTNGTRDLSFGPAPHGFMKQQVCYGGSCGMAEADAVALMGNGDIVVAGVAVNNQSFFVMRLTPTGALDSGFAQAGSNGAGVDAFRLGGVATGYHVGGVAVQSDGGIVVDGTFNSTPQGFIARIPSGGGALDTAGWNNPNGYTTEASNTTLSGLALQPSDGKAVAVGTDTSSSSVLIARFTTAGAQDTTTFRSPFGYNEAKIGAGPDTGAALLATSDGRLIVAGTDGSGVNAGIGLFQFKQSDGSLDTSFAGTGAERMALPSGDAGNVTALATDIAGRLLVAGQDTTVHHTFVARLSAAGVLDSSFGSGGFSIPTTIGSSDGAQGVTSDSVGNPVVGGFGTPSGAPDTDAMSARLLGATPPPAASTGTTSTTATGTTSTTTTSTTSTSPPTLPILSRVSQTHSNWREGSALAKLAAARKRPKPRPPIGTTFAFTLNLPATVTFVFAQQQSGRMVKGRCVPPSRRNGKRRPCKRSVSQGSLTVNGRSGANRLSFAGRLSRSRKLPLGGYTVTITATAAGQRSRSRALSFTIVR